MPKLAVILLNMGGPDKLESVEPFLFNLFNDPAIIGAPKLIRWCLAKYISKKRASIARQIYQKIGGKSPILDRTRDQAKALENLLIKNHKLRVFISMRYWHPFSYETAHEVFEYDPDQIILLPLYPQFSTATTESSIKDWHQAAKKAGINAETSSVCCYPTEPGFIKSLKDLILNQYKNFDNLERPRILFSAHGLPKILILKGDPYLWQVEQTVSKLVKELGIQNLDWVICYQSRVGRKEWIKPYIDDEIKRAADDKKSIIMVPIAFVSEHSETLVELDIEYYDLAKKLGVPKYKRIPTVGISKDFIKGLGNLIESKIIERKSDAYILQKTFCPTNLSRCFCHIKEKYNKSGLNNA